MTIVQIDHSNRFLRSFFLLAREEDVIINRLFHVYFGNKCDIFIMFFGNVTNQSQME